MTSLLNTDLTGKLIFFFALFLFFGLTNIGLLVRTVRAVFLSIAAPSLRDARHAVLTHKLLWAAGLRG